MGLKWNGGWGEAGVGFWGVTLRIGNGVYTVVVNDKIVKTWATIKSSTNITALTSFKRI